MASMCRLCRINAATGTTDFCSSCKDPQHILGVCTTCGSRFTLTTETLQELIDLHPELGPLTPQLGMSIGVSACSICGSASSPPTITIYR